MVGLALKRSGRLRRKKGGGWGSAKPTEYRGVMYDSKSEAAYAAYLDLLKKARRIRGWERQSRWELLVNGVKVCHMIPDFRVEMTDGTFELHEVKGFPTAVWRLKRKLMAALHPEVVYRIIPAKEALALQGRRAA